MDLDDKEKPWAVLAGVPVDSLFYPAGRVQQCEDRFRSSELPERLDHVTRSIAGYLHVRNFERGMSSNRQFHHLDPCLRGGDLPTDLVRRNDGWNEHHAIQAQLLAGLLSENEM